jgi:hypothetical protein
VIQKSSYECEDLLKKMDLAIRNVHYLAAILKVKATEKQLSPSVISLLDDDIKYATSIRFEDLQDISNKILEFMLDFTVFIKNNKEIQKLLINDNTEEENS